MKACEHPDHMVGLRTQRVEATWRCYEPSPTTAERCTKCSRIRPDYIADPSCREGGYCEWQPIAASVKHFCDEHAVQWRSKNPRARQEPMRFFPSNEAALDVLASAASKLAEAAILNAQIQLANTRAMLTHLEAIRSGARAPSDGYTRILATLEDVESDLGELAAMHFQGVHQGRDPT